MTKINEPKPESRKLATRHENLEIDFSKSFKPTYNMSRIELYFQNKDSIAKSRLRVIENFQRKPLKIRKGPFSTP